MSNYKKAKKAILCGDLETLSTLLPLLNESERECLVESNYRPLKRVLGMAKTYRNFGFETAAQRRGFDPPRDKYHSRPESWKQAIRNMPPR